MSIRNIVLINILNGILTFSLVRTLFTDFLNKISVYDEHLNSVHQIKTNSIIIRNVWELLFFFFWGGGYCALCNEYLGMATQNVYLISKLNNTSSKFDIGFLSKNTKIWACNFIPSDKVMKIHIFHITLL